MRSFWRPLFLTAALLAMPQPGLAEDVPGPAFFDALRAADLRVATIGYRLTTANAALCRHLQPDLGMPLHALDQYSPAARSAADKAFGFASDVAVEAVVPDGPAARAGVRAGDSLIAVNGAAQPPKPAPADTNPGTAATRIAAEEAIARLPPDRPVALTLRHDGHDRTVSVMPVPGCRTGVEMMLEPTYDADSDGEKLRISSRFLEDFDDESVAVVLAHELSHTILEHRRRLEAAKVSYGLLAEVGRNGRIWRETEDDADRMSAYVLYNAGYDPQAAVRFWRGKGGDKVGGGVLRSRTHSGPNTRAAIIGAEAAKIPPGAPRPFLPPLLKTRDEALK